MRIQHLIKRLVLVMLLVFSHSSLALKYLDIWEYQIEGNTLLSDALIARSVAPYLGVARTIPDIEKAAQVLQQEYRNAGYATVYVGIPEQDVVGGMVRLEVVESKLRRVKITGARYFTLSGIRAEVPSLEEGVVLHVPTLQKELQQANKANANLKVIPIITQGPTSNDVDVELDVADELPFSTGFSVSNYNTEGTTPIRLSAQFAYNNLWQQHHSFSMQAQTSPENTDEVKLISASYSMPLGGVGNDNKLAVYGVLSDSEIASVSDVNVIGDGTILGFRYVMPFKQSASSVHSFSLGGDLKDFEEDLILIDGSVTQTPIKYTSWTASYNLFVRGEKITDEMSAGVTFGIRGLFNDDDEFNSKRSLATPNFALFNVDWKRRYRFAKNWHFSHQVRAQLADSPLVTNEQYSAGGVATVRGYYESQIQGDYGFIGNLEIETPNFGKGWPGVSSMKALWFYDAARLRLQDALASQEEDFKIYSTGLGLQTKLLEHIDLTVDSGYALRDAGKVNKDSVRTRARLSVEF